MKREKKIRLNLCVLKKIKVRKLVDFLKGSSFEKEEKAIANLSSG